jgi:hypothetical protein
MSDKFQKNFHLMQKQIAVIVGKKRIRFYSSIYIYLVCGGSNDTNWESEENGNGTS